MPDRNSSGQITGEATSEIKLRKMQLQLKAMEVEHLKRSIEILEWRENIIRAEQEKLTLEDNMAQLKGQLDGGC